jgi:hypothetical protein
MRIISMIQMARDDPIIKGMGGTPSTAVGLIPVIESI